MEIPEIGPRVENAHTAISGAGIAVSQGIWALAWSQDNIVTGAINGSMKVWDVVAENNHVKIKQKTEYADSKLSGGIVSVATTQNGSTAVACHQHSPLRFFDLEKQLEVGSISPGIQEAWSICLSPGDDVLASGNGSGQVNLWSMKDDHSLVHQLDTQNRKYILSTCFNVQNKLASSSIDGNVSIFDLETLEVQHNVKAHALPIRQSVFSPHGDLIFTASDDRHCNVYDLKSGKLINSFSHASKALSVDTSGDCRHFAVGCADNSVSLWDLGMQKQVTVYNNQHKDQVNTESFLTNQPTSNR
jgi:WD40 repeat protein